MATDAEAAAAGFKMPKDADPLKEGDDAIRHNARTTLDLVKDATWWHRPLLLPETDILTLAPGVYGVASGGTATAIGMPSARVGTLTVRRAVSNVRTFTFQTNHLNASYPVELWSAGTNNAGDTLGPWRRHLTVEDTAGAGVGSVSIRHQLTAQDMRAYYGGTVKTGGAVPVALTFDDFPAAFRDVVLPLLRTRKLPATLGLGSGMYEPASTRIYDGAAGTTWAEIDHWTTADRVEIANHGRTHGNATTPAGLQSEIVTGLAELRAALPSRPIFTWMQPASDYGTGFDNGATVDSYAATLAGQLILEHHAYATGVRKPAGSTTVPRDGHLPPQGIARNWFDSSRGIEGCKTLINTAPRGHGLVLAAHPNRYGMPEFATVAELAAFLDWLVAEQTAGRIKVLTLSEWTLADAGS